MPLTEQADKSARQGACVAHPLHCSSAIMSVKVYSEQLARTLLDVDEPGSSMARATARRTRISASAAAKEARLVKMQHRFDIYNEEQEQLQRQNLRRVKERLQRNAARKEAKFVRGFNKLMEGQKMTREIKTMLDLQAATDARKCRQEYEAWDQDVYSQINGTITDRVNRLDYHASNARKRAEFQQYLDTTNKKGAIFRDIIIENEYDPLESNRKDIHIRMDKLHDPTSRVLDKAAEERGMVEGVGEAGRTGGRYTLEVPQWATGKIEATPHGHFAKMTEGTKELDERMKKLTQSTVFLDHFNVPRGNDVSSAEFPLGKRCTMD
eukprot:g5922.t1